MPEPLPEASGRPSWLALVVIAAACLFVGAALGYRSHGAPAARPPATPASVAPASPAASFAPGQQVRCGRLDVTVCAQVLGVVESRVPETRLSTLAIADYAGYPGPGQTLSPRATQIYLVAFAPWPGSENIPMRSVVPTWRVSNLDGTWVIYPQASQGELPPCFTLLLQEAGFVSGAVDLPAGWCP